MNAKKKKQQQQQQQCQERVKDTILKETSIQHREEPTPLPLQRIIIRITMDRITIKTITEVHITSPLQELRHILHLKNDRCSFFFPIKYIFLSVIM